MASSVIVYLSDRSGVFLPPNLESKSGASFLPPFPFAPFSFPSFSLLPFPMIYLHFPPRSVLPFLFLSKKEEV